RYIWGIFLGSLTLNALLDDSLWAIGGITLVNVAEPLVGVWLLTRNKKLTSFLDSLPSYLHLIVLGGVVASLFGGIIGPLSLLLAGFISPADYFRNSLHWWMGDTLGVVLITTLILAWHQVKPGQQINKKLLANRKVFEGLLLVGVTFIFGQIVFLDWFHQYFSDTPKGYVMFLFVAWIAIRLKAQWVTFVVLMIAIQGLFGAYHTIGFFAHDIARADLFNYWTYMLIISIVGMAMTSYVEEAKQKALKLQKNETQLTSLVNAIPDLIWLKDAEGVYLSCNHMFERFFGAKEADVLGKTDYDFVDKALADFFRENDRKAIVANKPNFNEEWLTFADNGYHGLFETTKTSLRDKEGNLIGVLGIAHDITGQKLAENDLRIAAISFESQEGMLVTDAKRIILRVNRAFTIITGYSAEESIGKTPSMLSSGQHDAAFYADMWERINSTGDWEGEIWNQRKNGEVYPQYLTITAVKGADNIITNYVATLTDITERKQAADEIEYLAFYDSLTHLPNRRMLLDRLKRALAVSARNGRDGAVLFLDLDHFKTLNDSLGHAIGDLLLQQVSERLTDCLREGDTVARLARLGGDEFVVMLEDLSENPLKAAAQAEVVANKILIALNQPYQLSTHEYQGTATIGVAFFRDHEYSQEDLLKHADIAMYQAKKAGRNTLRFFDPKMQEVINTRADMERELRKAIEKQQFHLFYQIQVNHLGCPVGAEALIRWIHPERGLVSPFHFIPLAEETGLILPIGQWVLETACAQIKAWEQGSVTRNLTLSINVSAKQFYQADFVSQVHAAIMRHAIDPMKLKLELTESMLLERIEETIATMNELNVIGIRFSLDDFGTGYSSLQYLKRLPLYQLKIDQSFVRDIAVDSSDQAIVHTIIAMANTLNLNVIAEGVETEEQKGLLLNSGCKFYQGYLFGKPVPIEQFEVSLTSKSDLVS
ncbi:MAG: EAL domain-containing protein, partial [Methylotenera sp.]